MSDHVQMWGLNPRGVFHPYLKEEDVQYYAERYPDIIYYFQEDPVVRENVHAVMSNVVDVTEEDHAGCQSAYEREKARADFLEARLAAFSADLYDLSTKFDGEFGYQVFERFGNKTPAGAIRNLRSKYSMRGEL